jgi:uncharacterized protein YecT (DUF1311 family)
MRRVLASVALCALLSPAPSSAAEDRHAACIAASGGVTTAILDCNVVELAWLDSRLNAYDGELAAILPPDRRTALRDVQRAWMRFRDRDGAFLNDPVLVGTSGTVNHSSGHVEMTRQRVEILKGWLETARALFE